MQKSPRHSSFSSQMSAPCYHFNWSKSPSSQASINLTFPTSLAKVIPYPLRSSPLSLITSKINGAHHCYANFPLVHVYHFFAQKPIIINVPYLHSIIKADVQIKLFPQISKRKFQLQTCQLLAAPLSTLPKLSSLWLCSRFYFPDMEQLPCSSVFL